MAGRPPDDERLQQPDVTPSPPVDEGRRELVKWLWRVPVIAGAGAAAFAAYRAFNVQFEREPASDHPLFEEQPALPIAPLADFTAVWHAAEFSFAGLPVIALRLPEAVPGGLTVDGRYFVAFSRVCTHQGCIVNLNRDTEAVAFAFNYRSSSPALVCECHLSVFAPLLAGESVSGPALRPLPRIQLSALDGELLATGVEKT
jgi:Rieske Fe-S protein